MILNWFIAENVSEVGVSFFDFYSIGHICMGIGVFLFFSLFYTVPMSKQEGYKQVGMPLWVVWIITVIIGIAWEFLENIIFYEWGIKFEGRRDSLLNVISDIMLVGVGGLSTWLFAHLIFKHHKKVWPYYLFGIIGFSIWLGFFIIARYLFL
ncbi:MAG: hypothetical protein P8Y70_05230 [Candidatus Lokiarchaeota archaeon]